MRRSVVPRTKPVAFCDSSIQSNESTEKDGFFIEKQIKMKNNLIKSGKIGSVLKNLKFPTNIELTTKIQSIEGEIIVAKALKSQKKYGNIELTDGKMSKIKKGDIVIGVLGQRKALEGIVGKVPDNLQVNDVIHILNLGGVLGLAESWNPDFITNPLPVQVMGAITHNDSTLNIQSCSLKPESSLHKTAPIILILGSSMGVGKTTIVKEVVHLLAKEKRLKIAAGKLTGVAAKRDLVAMKRAGANPVLSFLDAGLISTVDKDKKIVSTANTVLNALNKEKPNFLVIELGDGVVGWYSVHTLLQYKEFIKAVSFIIGCANDLVGAMGLYEVLKKIGLKIDFFAGPVTNNTAGTDYLEKFLKIPGQDLRHGHTKLIQALQQKGVL